jgi:glycosyltransferase involved in cell wall biosynthesis
MRILCNGLRRLQGGNLRYFNEIVSALSKTQGVELVVLIEETRACDFSASGEGIVILPISISSQIIKGIYQERRAVIEELKNGYDVFFSPNTLLPFYKPSICSAVTVQDLNFRTISQGLLKDLYKRILYSYAARHADVVFAVSEFTKMEMTRYYSDSSSKIAVIGEGADLRYLAQDTDSGESSIVDGNYLFTFGHLPNKNVEGVIDFFMECRAQSHSDLRLKIAGTGLYIKDKVIPYIEHSGAAEYVDLLGFVSDGSLISLYRNASALIFLSKYEGFGLPVLEAMSLSCPVIVSSSGALPELVGEAGFVVDGDQFAPALQYFARLQRANEFKENEIAKGIQRAANYSWSIAANKIVSNLRCLIARRRS